jgi:hypothetical protein
MWPARDGVFHATLSVKSVASIVGAAEQWHGEFSRTTFIVLLQCTQRRFAPGEKSPVK